MGIFTSPLAVLFAAVSLGVGLYIGLKLANVQVKAIRSTADTKRGDRQLARQTGESTDAVMRLRYLTLLVFRLQLAFSPLVAMLVLLLGAPKQVGLVYLVGMVLTVCALLVLRRSVKL
jgi:hypothetical protein